MLGLLIFSNINYNKIQNFLLKIDNIQMNERKTWTAEEDQILRQLYERRCIKKWSKVSQIMEKEYLILGRSGKQCRQRYHNHLKGGIRKERWTQEEEEELVELHAKHGNKWALISKLIRGRTENCVKNMFNSKLRKSVRLLNRFIYLYQRKTLKQIKLSFINRLSEFTETAHKKSEDQRSPEQSVAIQIKNNILRQGDYQVHQMNQSEKLKVRSLILEINNFKKENSKHYRGNVLARVRKQKLRRRCNEDHQNIEAEIDSSIMPKQSQNPSTEQPSKKINLKQTNIKKQNNIVRQEDYLQLVKETCSNQASLVNPIEVQPTSTFRVNKKRTLQRLQSLQSNYSSILCNKGLQNPIQVENYVHNITPFAKYDGQDFLDWTLSVADWRFNAD